MTGYRSTRTTLLFGVTAFATLVGSAAAQDDFRIEEITVTATKMGETSLQDTPLAITAFTSELMDRTGIREIRDLMTMTPNLNVAQNAAFAQVYIRGIGSNNIFAGADPSSTIHIDGVYIARPASYFASFLDVERVEVLRGPQGTLYGRNSVGGTINVVSRKPSNEFQAKVQTTIGSQDLMQAEGYVSGPLVEDKVAASVSVMRSKRDGYFENIVPGARAVDDEDMWSGRVQFRVTPSDRLDITLRGDYMQDDGQTVGNVKLLLPWAPLEDSILDDKHKVALDAPGFMKRKNRGVSAEIIYDISDYAALTSISAYRKNLLDAAADTDATSDSRQITEQYEKQDQISQELNLSGKWDRLGYVGGLYYFQEDILADAFVNNLIAGVRGNPNPSVDTEAWAAFTQATYDVTEQLSLTAGIRYTEETKKFDQNFTVFQIGTGNILVGPVQYSLEETYKAWTPKFGIEFRPTEEVMVYASATRGFKSGGFNFASQNANQGYDPEFLWSYEAGVKSDLFDRRLRVNATAFYYDYTNLQVQSFLTPGVIDITNAADAKVKGFEVELIARPVQGLDIGATLAHLDATYKNYPEAPVTGGVFDASGNRLSSAPKWNYSLYGQYTFDIADAGEIFVRGEYAHRSRQFFTVVNDDLQTQGSYGLLNASVGYGTEDGNWQIIGYGRNLTNEEYIVSSGSFTARPAGRPGAPRTYGVRLLYKY